jgi:hypothetical protein
MGEGPHLVIGVLLPEPAHGPFEQIASEKRLNVLERVECDRLHLGESSLLAAWLLVAASWKHQQLPSRHQHEPHTTFPVHCPHVVVTFAGTECMVERDLTHP